MTKKVEYLNYLDYSRNLLTSILFIFPLLILYEILSFLIFSDKSYEIRNSADIFIRAYFYNFGTSSQFLYITFLISLMILYIFLNSRKYKDYNFSPIHNLYMICEGVVYGLTLMIILNGYSYFLKSKVYVYEDFFLNFYFSLGAGVWEEILFRLIIFNIFT